MQFTHIFFSFFTNTLMNEDSVLPDLLPDLLPACVTQLPGSGWGSEARSGAAFWEPAVFAPMLRAAPRSPLRGFLEGGLILPEASVTVGSSKHNLGLITSFPVIFSSPSLLPAWVTGTLEGLGHVGSPKTPAAQSAPVCDTYEKPDSEPGRWAQGPQTPVLACDLG